LPEFLKKFARTLLQENLPGIFSLLKENQSPKNIDFLRKKYFVKGSLPKMSEFLKNKYFLNKK
jgi:cyclopropane fatty-acyl-phospholipid synthase-like methyltransferase